MSERTKTERSRRIRMGLAGLAVLGVGVVATSALWTDDVWFSGSMSATEFNLQGSVESAAGAWKESATEGAIELPLGAVEISPTAVTKTVWIKNDGSSRAANLAAPVVTVSGELADDVTVTAAYDTFPTGSTQAALLPDAVVPVVVTYTLKDGTTNAQVAGETGTLTVKVTGTEVAPSP